MNQVESRSIMTGLSSRGFDVTEELVPADFYVINTCSVTAEADRKSRQMITRVRKLALSPVIVCGCSSQNKGESFLRDGVVYVCGTANKEESVLKAIDEYLSGKKSATVIGCDNRACEFTNLPPYNAKTRVFIKIQDGCNRFCSYCIIPFLRGRSRSRAIEDVVREVQAAAKHTKEIVLTGVDTSSYGLDIGTSLEELVGKLGNVGARLRIGSLECEVIDENLLLAMRRNGFCDHFHLSLQSGSDNVLKAMRRKYLAEFFLSKVELIREVFPQAGITTDIIVGFPTETDRDFEESVDFIKRCAFSDIHFFPYSRRTGTTAAQLKPIAGDVMDRRLDIMAELKRELKRDFITSLRGEKMTAYFETQKSGIASGYTGNYIKVYSKEHTEGEVGEVVIGEPFQDGCLV